MQRRSLLSAGRLADWAGKAAHGSKKGARCGALSRQAAGTVRATTPAANHFPCTTHPPLPQVGEVSYSQRNLFGLGQRLVATAKLGQVGRGLWRLYALAHA